MMTLTKADLVERIYERVGCSKKEATEVVEAVFGNFVVAAKHARKGRNPQTGEEIVIAGRRVLTFKASQVLKKTMNDGDATAAVGD